MKLSMYWLEVLRLNKDVTCCAAGPKTSGGLIVEMVKVGFSLSRNSQAAFSANVLLAIRIDCQPNFNKTRNAQARD